MPEWKEEIRQRLASLKLQPAREAEIVEELSQHLDDHYSESLARGATPEEAHRAALAELSESELLARELQQVERAVPQEPVVLGANRRINMLGGIWQDLRYGARMLAKTPGFTLLAIITLSLGIVTGLLLAMALTRGLSSYLYGVSAADPFTYLATTLLLMVVALLACYFPARRAASVDPMTALRHD